MDTSPADGAYVKVLCVCSVYPHLGCVKEATYVVSAGCSKINVGFDC